MEASRGQLEGEECLWRPFVVEIRKVNELHQRTLVFTGNSRKIPKQTAICLTTAKVMSYPAFYSRNMVEAGWVSRAMGKGLQGVHESEWDAAS